MGEVLFIGDRLSAAGFRLGGARIAAMEEAAALLADPPEGTELLLITAEAAKGVTEELLGAARRRIKPPLLVIPDVRGQRMPEDTATRLRHQLGMAE